VGLAQRLIEAAGFATVSLSTIAEFTAATGAPRVAAIEYPMGRPLGQPGDRGGQAAVLRSTLKTLEAMEKPGVFGLPFEWTEPPSRARAQSLPEVLPPIATYLKRRPWLFPKLLSGDIPE
jgi:hypothetical protein